MEFKLYYEACGEGFPLVLLHGNGENLHYFDRQIPAFSSLYRVIAVDTRGHGKSPRGDKPFTLRQFSDDLLEFLDRLELKKVHLLGFSDGGNIALLFALEHPERVEKLILNGANLDPSGLKRKEAVWIEEEYRAAVARADIDPQAAKKAALFGLMVHEPDLTPADLRRLTVPTLVIAGTRDMIRREHTRQIARAIPGARLLLLDGTHFVAREDPERFNAAVISFLKGD